MQLSEDEEAFKLVGDEILQAIECVKSEKPYRGYFLTSVSDIEHSHNQMTAWAKGYLI